MEKRPDSADVPAISQVLLLRRFSDRGFEIGSKRHDDSSRRRYGGRDFQTSVSLCRSYERDFVPDIEKRTNRFGTNQNADLLRTWLML